MRLRNVKNKEEIMNNSPYLIKDAKVYKNKWNTLFNNDNPIYLEIGMGKGKFIIENALKYPEINFIGMECFDSVLARALEKIPEGVSNLKIIRGNARDIEEMFGKEIDLIYLNFSDPWPKKRHALRRLTSPIFLEHYEKIFKKDAIIIQKTDNQHLFEYSLESMSNHGYSFSELSLDLHKSEIEENITTEYEERFMKLDNRIYRVVAQKKLSN